MARGIDMFDCVMPTRNGRHGMAFTRFGQINLRNARHADDPRPLDEESAWPSTRELFARLSASSGRSGETLGAMLLSEINIAYYQHLMQDMRAAIGNGSFEDFKNKRAPIGRAVTSLQDKFDQLQANRLTECLVTKP